MFYSFWNGIRRIGIFLQSPFLLLIRLYWGYQFAITGFGKFLHLADTSAYFQSLGIPFPYFNTIMASSTEMIGGILLLLGLFSRIASIPLAAVMVVSYLTAGYDTLVALFINFNPDPFVSHTSFLFLYAVLIVFCFGPGKISLDYWLTGAYKTKEMP
jgi:putative oxidoreductase